MSQDDRKPDADAANDAVTPAAPGGEAGDKTEPPPAQAAPAAPAKPKRKRAPRKTTTAATKSAAAGKSKAKPKTTTASRRRSTKKTSPNKPASAEDAAPAPAAQPATTAAANADAPSKLDHAWAIIGVVFYAGIGLLVLVASSLLSIAACLFTMATDEPASGLDGIRQDLRAYGAQILDFMEQPLGTMPFPFSNWPGKAE